MAEARRAQVLAAMGIEVLRLRGSRAHSMQPADREDALTPTETPRVLIVCARGHRTDARTMRIAAQLPRALGTSAASIAWCEADARGEVAPPPQVPAYLVLGTRMAHALGAQLPTTLQNAAVIAVIGEPEGLPVDASGKRVLWQALKPIARALRESA